MSTQISGDTGVSKVQDGIVTSNSIADGTILLQDLETVLRSLQIKAKVVFNGLGTVGQNQTIISSYNVASVFKNANGDYTITFTTALADATYSAQITALNDQSSCPVCSADNATPPSTTVLRVSIVNDVGTRISSARVSVIVQ